jgi:hypothetical protein
VGKVSALGDIRWKGPITENSLTRTSGVQVGGRQLTPNSED